MGFEKFTGLVTEQDQIRIHPPYKFGLLLKVLRRLPKRIGVTAQKDGNRVHLRPGKFCKQFVRYVPVQTRFSSTHDFCSLATAGSPGHWPK